ncbi:uncharacterized protein LOC134279251 [Saccostrea cucullata]|uniref:uncharacterized protein LOC134279251 n=1 Tax=Saccostrea cuccullata TaxID=36930 RepID=UPI002ED352C9
MAVPNIPLPYGKKYHIFMSFCSEDQEIALSLIEILENHYQLKCLNHIRDFVPGVPSVENILNGIENSMKIVYLISKKFKDSYLCSTEILYGIKASHDQCENSTIPVLLEKTKMPRELETINYVNATITGTDIASKIYDACLFGASDSSILPNFIPFQDLYNGQPLRVIESRKHWELGLPYITFVENTKERHNISNHSKSRKIDSLCDNILQELNSSDYKKWYPLYDCGFLCLLWFLFTCGFIAFCLCPFLLYLIIEAEISQSQMAAACSTAVIIPFVIASMIFCFCSCRYTTVWIDTLVKENNEIFSIVWKNLKENYIEHNILPLLSTNEKIVLLNYDTDPCKQFIIYVLKRKFDDMESIKKMADDLILEFIRENRTKLVDWTLLEDFKYNRHNTYLQKKCICQHLEPHIM